MNGMSMDLTQKNIERIKELFPNVVVEGRIDFDLLREILGESVDYSKEKYQFTWNGKSDSIKMAQSPSASTLRPAKELSKEWESTENLYIEGDNLEVLKQLQKTYFGKIKMIYIDPPYNTGGDFVYKDDFKDTIENYKEQTNQTQKSNPETSGRYHSDWLNLMYPRLILARNLLRDDGAIFISIDDNEQTNLKKICDEVFGEENFVTLFIWEKKKKPSFLHRNVGKLGDYILCYTKNTNRSIPFSVETTTEGKKYPLNNAGNTLATITFPPKTVRFNCGDGIIQPQDMSEGNIKTELLDELTIENGFNKDAFRLKGEWRYSQETLDGIVENGEEIVISKIPFRPNHIKTGGEIKKMKNFLTTTHYSMETNEDATQQLIDLFGVDLFDNPKPVKLIETFIKALTYNDPDAIICDFFSGSATTAHSVMKLNCDDGGHRKFIMVQLPEQTDEKKEAHKAGFKTICEIGEERIRRAGEKIKKDWIEKNDNKGLLSDSEGFNVDIGFKVFKLDSTNLNPWDNTKQLDEQTIFETATVFKLDRSNEDVLYEIMLKYGVFDQPTSEVNVNDKTLYRVGSRHMIICLEDNIDEKDIDEICKLEPRVAVFKEDGFKDDNAKINAEYNLKKAGVEDVKCI